MRHVILLIPRGQDRGEDRERQRDRARTEDPLAAEAAAAGTVAERLREDRDIELALRQFLFRANNSGEPVVEIIPGKGSGRLKARVLAFLDQKHIQKLYVRREVDSGNAGRILVYFE